MKENSKNGDTIPPLLNVDQTLSISDSDKANTLNDYFVSISSLDDTNTILPDLVLKTNTAISDIDVSEQEITDVLCNLVINKASGPDEISHRMLKETSKSISLPLKLLFNRSLNEGIYPAIWKLANVMPIFKKRRQEHSLKLSTYLPN